VSVSSAVFCLHFTREDSEDALLGLSSLRQLSSAAHVACFIESRRGPFIISITESPGSRRNRTRKVQNGHTRRSISLIKLESVHELRRRSNQRTRTGGKSILPMRSHLGELLVHENYDITSWPARILISLFCGQQQQCRAFYAP